MMRNNTWLGFTIAFTFTIILDLIIGWPSTLVAGVAAGFCFRKALRAFLITLLATGCAWMLMALIPALWSSTWLLASKLVQIPGLSSDFAFLMFLITAITGGLLGGLGASNTVILRRLFSNLLTLSKAN